MAFVMKRNVIHRTFGN